MTTVRRCSNHQLLVPGPSPGLAAGGPKNRWRAQKPEGGPHF